MGRAPFEKIRSLVERRKLFEALLREKTEILCKGEDDSLFQFIPTSIAPGDMLQGVILEIEKVPASQTEILGNFSVGADRFFFQSTLQVAANLGTFEINCDLYKLQRRATVRLHLPSSYGIYFSVTELRNRPVYLIAQLADLSAGGARLFFSNLDSPVPVPTQVEIPKLSVGDEMKGVLHVGTHRTFELKAVVRHSQQGVHQGQIVDHYGVEYLETSQGIKNRMIAMTLDLQRRIVLGDDDDLD